MPKINYKMSDELKEKRRQGVLRYYEQNGRKGTIDKNGYIQITIKRKRYYLHRLVWEQNFGKIPKGYHIHHKDKNKLNNNISNLELLSSVEHAKFHCVESFGKNRLGVSPTNKTDINIINKIKELRNNGYKLKDIQSIVGLSYPTVQKYAKGV